MALTSHTLNIANGLNLFRSETGLSTQELQKWQNAAKQFGVSNNAVEQSLMGISDAIVRIRRFGDGRAAMAFGRLGISSSEWGRMTPFEILGALRKSYAKKDPNEFRSFASQLGISPEMMRLFGAGEGEFNRSMRTSTMSDATLQRLSDFQAALGRFSITIENSFAPVLAQATPVLKDLAQAINIVAPILAGILLKDTSSISRGIVGIHEMGGWDAFMQGLILDSQGGDIAKKELQDARRTNVTINNNLTAHGDDATGAVQSGADAINKHLTKTIHQLQGK